MTEQASDQLKLLSDYTLFHIGLYASLISGLTALAHFKGARFEKKLFWALVLTVGCFLVAGIAGGIIASNIPNYSRFADYDQARLQVFGLESVPYRSWAHVEHIAFWVGILVAVVGFLHAAWPRSK